MRGPGRGISSIVLLLSLLAIPARVAFADIDDVDASNAQEGDNESDADRSGDAGTGDAVGGQIVGVVSSGDATVDATNRSEDVDARSGDATGANTAATFVGHIAVDRTAATDVDDVDGDNVQEGDNEQDTAQDFAGASGDAVAGQVTGVTTAPGGSADVTVANTSIGVDVETGDVEFGNQNVSVVGLVAVEPAPLPPPVPPPAPAFVLNVSDAVAREGQPLRFIVTLTRSVLAVDQVTASDVTFRATTRDGSATSGVDSVGAEDYSSTSATFTIESGQHSTTVNVPTNGFDECEPDETMHLIITEASGAEIGDGGGFGNIVDNCALPVGPTGPTGPTGP